MLSGSLLSYLKKRNGHSLPLVIIGCTTRYHSLSLVVLLVVIRCHSLYHSLSLVVTRCHSLSLDVLLVCLFINDQIWGSHRQNISATNQKTKDRPVKKHRRQSIDYYDKCPKNKRAEDHTEQFPVNGVYVSVTFISWGRLSARLCPLPNLCFSYYFLIA